LRVGVLFFGDSVLLGLAVDLRLEVGGPIFRLAVDVGFAGDSDMDVVDVDGFGAALVVG
jgi:hypothetical protein